MTLIKPQIKNINGLYLYLDLCKKHIFSFNFSLHEALLLDEYCLNGWEKDWLLHSVFFTCAINVLCTTPHSPIHTITYFLHLRAFYLSFTLQWTHPRILWHAERSCLGLNQKLCDYLYLLSHSHFVILWGCKTSCSVTMLNNEWRVRFIVHMQHCLFLVLLFFFDLQPLMSL